MILSCRYRHLSTRPCADKNPYRHDSRADKRRYWHDRCADSLSLDKLEQKSQSVENEDKIKEVGRKETVEQHEKENRKLNMVIFNVPESEEQSPEARKANDLEKVNLLLDGPMKLDKESIHIQNPFRLGALKANKPNEVQKPRPIKFLYFCRKL